MNEEPLTVTQGETVTWSKSLSDYPTSVWTLKYSFRSKTSGAKIDISAVADGINFLVSVPSNTTKDWVVENYWWHSWVEKGSGVDIEKHPIWTGQMGVLQDISTITTIFDGRSHAKTMLDAIEATLEGKATTEQLDLISKTIDVKNIQRNPKLLQDWRDYYKAEYQAEVNKAAADRGDYAGNKIKVQFKSPTSKYPGDWWPT